MSDYVTVACKLPNGLTLHIWEEIEERVPVPGGFETKKVKRRKPGGYTIRGNRIPFGVIADPSIDRGYAFTRGIPRQFWETWLEQNKDSEIVRRRLVYAIRQSP